mgnify:CR=1 FL=1
MIPPQFPGFPSADGFPARIAVAERYAGSCHFEYGTYHSRNVLFGRLDRTALACLDTDDVTGFHLYGCQIGGGFHKTRKYPGSWHILRVELRKEPVTDVWQCLCR